MALAPRSHAHTIGNSRRSSQRRTPQHFLVPPTSTRKVWTLGQVSSLTGTPVHRLQALNPQITHPNFVLPGQAIRYA